MNDQTALRSATTLSGTTSIKAATHRTTEGSSSRLLDWALVCLPGLIWGASFLFIAEGLEALAPDGVTFARFVIGFVTLSMVPGARRPVLTSDRAHIGWLGVL
jgi:drug/metabolite transporter (DMT)-like permease